MLSSSEGKVSIVLMYYHYYHYHYHYNINITIGVQVGPMGYVPSYGGDGNSRNLSCSKPGLHCRKRPWEGALYKWLTRSASDAMHMALYK